MTNPPENRYPDGTVAPLRDPAYRPCVVSIAKNDFILSRRESGDIVVLTDNQSIINIIPVSEVRRLALWLLEGSRG